MSENSPQWIYILLCENNSFYTGFTTDMIKRYRSHIDGSGKAKYTRSFKPIRIAQCWRLENAERGVALRIEAFVKKQNRKQKSRLIEAPESLGAIFAEASGTSVDLVNENLERLEQDARAE